MGHGSKEPSHEGNLGFVKDQVEASEVSHGTSQRAFGQLQTADEHDAVASKKVESDALCNNETIKKEANAVLNGACLKSSQDSNDKSVASKKRKSKIDKKLAAA